MEILTDIPLFVLVPVAIPVIIWVLCRYFDHCIFRPRHKNPKNEFGM